MAVRKNASRSILVGSMTEKVVLLPIGEELPRGVNANRCVRSAFWSIHSGGVDERQTLSRSIFPAAFVAVGSQRAIVNGLDPIAGMHGGKCIARGGFYSRNRSLGPWAWGVGVSEDAECSCQPWRLRVYV